MDGEVKTNSRSEAKLRRLGAYIAAIFLGGLFGLSIAFIIVALRGRGILPEISAENVTAARQTWNRVAAANYDLTVVVRSHDLSTYRVNVRDGIVQSAFRNDRPLRQQRTLGTWTVQGMFETIEEDFRTIELHRQGKAEVGTPQLSLRGKFDERLGYPERYQRTEMRKFGANTEVSWEVTNFQQFP
jgi:hypothetical protein